MSKKGITIINAIAVFTVVSFVLLRYWPNFLQFVADKADDGTMIADLGVYGDSFGALTAIFTLGAFVALCVTLSLQIQELRIQRRELRLQHEEMEKNRMVFADQKQVMQMQKAETTLFNILHMYDRIGESYDAKAKEDAIYAPFTSGQDGMEQMARKFFLEQGNDAMALDRFVCMEEYQRIFVSDRMLNWLLLMLDYVNDNFAEEKDKYLKIIRIQLSSFDEIIALLECYQHGGDEVRMKIWEDILDKRDIVYWAEQGGLKKLIEGLNAYARSGTATAQ